MESSSEASKETTGQLDRSSALIGIWLLVWLVPTWLYYFLLLKRNSGGTFGWPSPNTVSLFTAVGGTVITVVFAYWTIRLARNGSCPTFLVATYAITTVGTAVYTFAVLYYRFGADGDWNIRLSHLDALFVAAGTLTAGGIGDIEPKSELARGLLLGELGVGIVAFTVIVAVVIERLTRARL